MRISRLFPAWAPCLALLAPLTACEGADDDSGTSAPPPTSSGLPTNGTTVATEPEDASSADGDTGKLDAPPPTDMPNVTDTSDGCEQDVDIVFVMDVSTTMGPFIDQLATEIIFVDEALDALALPSEPHYGLVVFVDDYALLNTGQPYESVALLQQDFNDWSAFTASNQQVGGGNPNTTWPENSLDAMYVAASAFQWRPAETTLRLIIHTTDDTFWDGPTVGNGVNIQHSYAETVGALQQGQVRDFSFAGQIGGQCVCEDVTPGWSSHYMDMATIPEATGGGVYDIDQVLVGTVSLADALADAVESTMCEPYPPIG